MSNLQKIVVLCVVLIVGVFLGAQLNNSGVNDATTQIDPPSLDLDAGPADTSVDDTQDPDLPDPVAQEVNSFEDCVAAGNPVMESYPRQCNHNGQNFVEVIEEPAPPAPDLPVACTMDVKQCPDGSFVGRVAPNCEFEACPAMELIECSPESKEAQLCTKIYQPVCAQVNVMCFTEPCDPVPQTYGNACMACMQDNVSAYSEGACAEDA